MAIYREVDFNALPPAVRERFVIAVTNPAAADAPIMREVQGVAAPAAGLGLVMLAGLFFTWVKLTTGFGEPGSADAVQPIEDALWYSVLMAAVVFGALALWRGARLRKSLPFPPGRYAFAVDLVDAQSRQLKIWPLAKMTNLKPVHQYSNGSYSYTTFTFSFEQGTPQKLVIRKKELAERALAQWNASQAEMRQAIDAQDGAGVSRLDPFFDARTTNWALGAPAAESEPLAARALPGFFRWRVAIALAGGVALALPLLLARNLLSDSTLYEQTVSAATERAYLDYLNHGWRHIDEARAALPRVAFNEAKKAGTVTALRGVAQRYPKAGLADDIKRELQVLYTAALAKFRAQAATADPTLVPFMEQLLGVLNDAGSSTLQVRFVRPAGDDLKKADTRMQLAAKQNGRELAPVARHFGADSAGPREARIVGEMTRGFRAIFPNDILNVAAPPTADTALPMMDIVYNIAPSGTIYKSDQSERLFIGVDVRFDGRILLPGSPKQWRFALDVAPPEHFTVSTQLPPGVMKGIAPDERVYVVMAERAFDELGQKLRTALFNPDSDAFKRAAGKQ